MRIGVVAVFLLASSMQSFGQLTAKPIDKTKKNKAISLTDTIPPVPTAGTMGIKDVDPYVTKWTDWQQLTIAPLTPNNPITDFGTELCKGSPNFPDLCVTTARLYIVHIMDWESIPAEKKVGENTKTPQVQLKASNWYFYQPAASGKQLDRINPDHKNLPTIMGVTNGVLLSISRIHNVGDPTVPIVKYDISAKENTPANVTALTSLITALLGASTTKAGPAVGIVEGGPPTVVPPVYLGTVQVYKLNAEDLRAPFTWTIVANASAKKSASEDPVVAADQVKNEETKRNLAGVAAADDPGPSPAPKASGASDCDNLTSSSKCSFTRVVSIDKNQYWNVGINLAPYGPRENKYGQSSSGTITTNHTIHSPLFAVIDLSPWGHMDKYPYIQTGVPLSGAAFHIPYVGLAQPLPFTKKFLQMSVFGGVVFMKQTFPKTLAVGQVTTTTVFNNDLQTDRAIKYLWGIEVPLTSVISKVKSSVGAGK